MSASDLQSLDNLFCLWFFKKLYSFCRKGALQNKYSNCDLRCCSGGCKIWSFFEYTDCIFVDLLDKVLIKNCTFLIIAFRFQWKLASYFKFEWQLGSFFIKIFSRFIKCGHSPFLQVSGTGNFNSSPFL